MGQKTQIKGQTPIARAAQGNQPGEVIRYSRPRRRGRNMSLRLAPTSTWASDIRDGAIFPPRAEHTPMLVCGPADGHCGKLYPAHYMTERRVTIDGNAAVCLICEDCRNNFLLDEENARRELGHLADLERQVLVDVRELMKKKGLLFEQAFEMVTGKSSPYVIAIAELLGEVEGLGLLFRLRAGVHGNAAFLD